MYKLIILTILLLLPAASQAKLYKIVDENGTVIFTDTAPDLGAEEYHPSGINAVGNPTYNMDKLNLVIPFIESNGAMIVNGSVNGIAMRFIVDTGATLVAIPPAIAQQAGLLKGPSKKVTAHTANGSIEVSQVTIANLDVAKVKQTQIEATIQSISPTDTKLGLLGMSFFSKYKMTLNHANKEIQLELK